MQSMSQEEGAADAAPTVLLFVVKRGEDVQASGSPGRCDCCHYPSAAEPVLAHGREDVEHD